MHRTFLSGALAALMLTGTVAPRATAAETPSAQQVLTSAAEQGKYTFLLFYKEDSQPTRKMAQTLKAGVAANSDIAELCFVAVTDPAQQAVVKRYGVSRAPLPFTLAIAPNGAITGLYSQKISDANIAEAFVTAGMADCMKAMQEKKLVLVCVQASARSQTPAAVEDFQSDPEFGNRIAVIAVQASDTSEAAFLQQMEVDPATVKGTTMVFLAPPAVLVGKFASTATKAEMAAALHAAGQCCDDPNCKHNHAPKAAQKSAAPKSAAKKSAAKRN